MFANGAKSLGSDFKMMLKTHELILIDRGFHISLCFGPLRFYALKPLICSFLPNLMEHFLFGRVPSTPKRGSIALLFLSSIKMNSVLSGAIKHS